MAYHITYREMHNPILLGLDRQIQAQSGDLAIPLEQFWIHWV